MLLRTFEHFFVVEATHGRVARWPVGLGACLHAPAAGGARRPGAHTFPMAVYVDGNCLMGPCRGRVDAEMHSFQAWALDVVA